MYDRSSTHRHAGYNYPQYPVTAPVKQYPTAHSTSSAFSASANPNEDWTKISDLAERRRIQNRIAQRNYRKKLKKRLEDLERRAGSSSASPEQRHAELHEPDDLVSAQPGAQRPRSSSNELQRDRTPEVLTQQYVLPNEDRSMFSEQFTRQLSTSPPPFSYASFPGTEAMSFAATYPPTTTYCLPGSAIDMTMYPQFLSGMQQAILQPQSLSSPPIKSEIYGDDEMSPFSMSYASMAGVDVPTAQPYDITTAAYTPSLSDSFDLCSMAGSPPDSMPRTPPMAIDDRY